jgi:hypothetical protein
MSLSITHLPTHWDAAEAYTVLAFLDLLRDQLWETYGDEITALLQAADTGSGDQRQIDLDFDDDLVF